MTGVVIETVLAEVVTDVSPRKGDKGDQGDQGPKGDTGDPGPKGDPGDAGTPGGPAGESAYQTAVDGGFVGTEEEWLATLVGTAGPKGDAGDQGPPGDDGAPGADGADATAIYGPKGAAGGVATLDGGGLIPVAQIPSAIARTTDITGAVAALVNSAPSVLDTLNELATALGDDPAFATTITTLVGTKASTAAIGGLFGNHSGWALGTDTDVYFAAPSWSAGALTGGVIRQATAIRLGSTYTQTSNPADTSVGSPLYINWNPTLNNTGASSQTGFFGPRGVIQVEGVVTYQQSAGFLHLSPVGYAEQLIQKNAPGVAVGMYGSWGMILNRIWEADGATVTLHGTDASAGHTSVIDNAVYFTKNSGTLDGSGGFEHVGFLSEPAILGNVTVSRIGFDVSDFATGSAQVAVIGGQSWGTGADADAHSVPLNIGLRIKPLLNGTTNIGILSQSSVVVSDGTDAHGKTLINAGSFLGIPIAGLSIYQNATDLKPVVELLADGGAGLLAFGPGGSSLPDFSIQRTGTAAALVTGTLTLSSPIFTSPVVSDGTFTVVDGTAAHGSVLTAVSAFGPGFNLFANTTDTQAAALLAIVGGAPTLAFGPGGSAARDVKIVRSGSAAALATGVFTFTSPVFAGTPTATGGSFVVTDGNAGHGSVGLGVAALGGAVQVFANTADTTVAAQLAATGLQIGPGGTTATDVKLLRTGAAAAAFTGVLTMTSPVINTGITGSAIDTDATFATGASTTVVASSAVKTALALKATLAASTTFTAGFLAVTNTVDTSAFVVTDGTAAHGEVFAGVGPLGPSIGLFGNSGDTVQRSVIGVTGMSLGPGGSSATDTKFLRTGVAAATITGQATFATGITMADATNIAANATTGTKIGTATTQKLAFWNATPVIQPASAAQALVGSSPPATGDTGATAGAFASAAHRDALVTCVTDIKVLVNQIRNDLVAVGIEKGSA